MFLERTGQLSKFRRRIGYQAVTTLAMIVVVFGGARLSDLPPAALVVTLSLGTVGFLVAGVAWLRGVQCPSCKRQLVLWSVVHQPIGRVVPGLFAMRECPVCHFVPGTTAPVDPSGASSGTDEGRGVRA